MARDARDAGAEAPMLREGSELGGLTLRRLIARDEFSSLWLTTPLEEGFAESCVRAIPASHFKSPDAYERLCAELAFWRRLGGCAVDLYDWGRSGEHFFLVMRHMPEGSAADQLGRDRRLAENLPEFAVNLAGALCEVHATSGPHGNLKPSNVFPVRGAGVLLSDFALPLWFDEFDKGCPALGPRLLHPYRAPEQGENLRDYDTRSDVYAFALILQRCLTGSEPVPQGQPTGAAALQWPSGLGPIMEQCLAADRDERPADGLELLEMVEQATGRGARRPHQEPASEPPAEDVLSALEEARALAGTGMLDKALDVLERLPPGTNGVGQLLDELEARQRACEELTEQAVRMAGVGEMAAAAEAVAQAEKQWSKSPTLMAVKAELAAEAPARPKEEPLRTEATDPLRAAIQAGKYDAARVLIEKLLRRGSLTAEEQQAVREFRRERVRGAFLDNIRTAKRLYVLGHRQEAGQHWLEAARWLPSGPHRERLRRVAGAAVRGKLRVAVQSAGAAASAPQAAQTPRRPGRVAGAVPAATPPVQGPSATKQRPKTRDRRALLWLLAAVGVLIGGGLALLLALRGH